VSSVLITMGGVCSVLITLGGVSSVLITLGGVSSVLITERNNICVANASDQSARKYKE